MANLILGTATFREEYGIANKGIKLESREISEIVVTAQTLGINEFDTAPAYAGAEAQLGMYLDQRQQPKISSKISKADSISVKLILATVKETLRRTRVSSLENLYLHDPVALSGTSAFETIAGLKEVVSLGLAKRVGASVYSIQALLDAKAIYPGLTVFQVPENICDRRMLSSSELVDLKNEGNQFNVRSIYLQGLLLMSPQAIPGKLQKAKTAVQQLKTFADSYATLPVDLCLAYGRAIPWASGIIIGAVNGAQLRQAVESKVQLPAAWETLIDVLPEAILDPRRW